MHMHSSVSFHSNGNSSSQESKFDDDSVTSLQEFWFDALTYDYKQYGCHPPTKQG